MKLGRSITNAVGLLAASLVFVGCSAGTGGGSSADKSGPTATGAFNVRRFSGTTLHVILDAHPWTDGVKAELPAFERATGIKVDLKTYAEDLYFDKMNQALRTSNPPDVFMTGLDYSVATQHAAGLLEPLTPYLDNASVTKSDYDLSDFPQGVLEPAQFDDKGRQQLFSIPISTETYILFYNKKLVQQYLDGKVPTTMDDLIAAARMITKRGAGKVYGSVERGVRSSAIVDTPTGFVLNRWPTSASSLRLPYNVWFDGAWNRPRMTDPAIMAGLSDYSALLAAGPPNKFNLDWPDATALFSQGKIAFYADASVFGPAFEDPRKSKVAGQVGYTALPAAAAGGTTGLWSWGLSTAKGSNHKGAAWAFTSWFTDRANTAKLGALTGGPPRQSAAENPGYRKALPAQYVDTVKTALSTARPTAVIKADVEPGLLVIVDNVIALANGQDPRKAAAKAQSAMQSAVR